MAYETSSFCVFMGFVMEHVDGSVNVAKVLSRACFNKWLVTRTLKPKYPEESFRKALTSHCRGIDGRKAFPPIIEAALLRELRKKKVWPCFEGTGCNIGKRGLQLQGYWESASLGKNDVCKTSIQLNKPSIKRKREASSISNEEEVELKQLQRLEATNASLEREFLDMIDPFLIIKHQNPSPTKANSVDLWFDEPLNQILKQEDSSSSSLYPQFDPEEDFLGIFMDHFVEASS